ncbi:hypothetical protein HJG60_011111 [Phyllostomus discolor]|uniref:Uncharacterized protein n=1 Tax=Phyllostomus discolor TaxID=89673 RepID=A0A834E7G0_9CHIR|nr:hypothetical protein HJG60_011111 [Phyllostomus discolor]
MSHVVMSISYLVTNRKLRIRSKPTRASSHEGNHKPMPQIVTENGHQQLPIPPSLDTRLFPLLNSGVSSSSLESGPRDDWFEPMSLQTSRPRPSQALKVLKVALCFFTLSCHVENVQAVLLERKTTGRGICGMKHHRGSGVTGRRTEVSHLALSSKAPCIQEWPSGSF